MHLKVRSLLERRSPLGTTDPIVMEVLAGARDGDHLQRLRRLLLGCRLLPVELADYESAAALYRSCREAGAPVRRLVDCLIAVVAIKAGVPVLHLDGDFDVLAKHSKLKIARR